VVALLDGSLRRPHHRSHSDSSSWRSDQQV